MVLPFATVRRVMPRQISMDGFSRFIFQNLTPEIYPLRFAAEGGQENYEQFFQQFNDVMHK
jgi:hypothetical protein